MSELFCSKYKEKKTTALELFFFLRVDSEESISSLCQNSCLSVLVELKYVNKEEWAAPSHITTYVHEMNFYISC